MFLSEPVKSLAHSNPTASAIFLSLSQRERPRRIVNITLLKQHLKQQKVNVSDRDFYLTFKALQKLEIGDLIFGRKGNPDVFVWYYDLRDVANIGIGMDVSQPKVMRVEDKEEPTPHVDAEKAVAEQNQTSIKVIAADNNCITISIPLEILKNLK